MKILIVSATKFEVDSLLEKMSAVDVNNGRIFSCKYKELEIDFLVTGLGIVATAYFTGKILDDSYDIAFNIGICGSFNRNLELGEIVNIYEDSFSELGAEDDDKFLTFEALNLPGISKIENKSGALHPIIESIPKVSGITVNTSHGNEASIKQVLDNFHPYVESMEGAAFMFVCENENIPYVQIR
ncbi:MAG: futalosine hydrolase, partial [Bacteroidetes bacterium]|nr:futalosine hydrolase [Bacteroidota bacterium]